MGDVDHWRGPRKNILFELECEAKNLDGDLREIAVSPAADPYQSDEAGRLTRKAVLILEQYHLRVQIATLGGMPTALDFDILARNRWKYCTQILFHSENLREEWEPGGATIADRGRRHSVQPMRRESLPGSKSTPWRIRPS